MKTIKELMQEYNLNIKGFSDYFEIPYRTVQKWANGERTPPEYLVKLMHYKLEAERAENEKV